MKPSTVSLSTLLFAAVAGSLVLVALVAQAGTTSGRSQESGLQSTKATSGDSLALESGISNAKIQLSPKDMATAASKHGKSGGKYYMYAESPKKGAYKMGFKRGNHKHEIERKESVHKSHVSSYFKWHDKKGKGSHKFEFKHKGKKHGKH